MSFSGRRYRNARFSALSASFGRQVAHALTQLPIRRVPVAPVTLFPLVDFFHRRQRMSGLFSPRDKPPLPKTLFSSFGVCWREFYSQCPSSIPTLRTPARDSGTLHQLPFFVTCFLPFLSSFRLRPQPLEMPFNIFSMSAPLLRRVAFPRKFI